MLAPLRRCHRSTGPGEWGDVARPARACGGVRCQSNMSCAWVSLAHWERRDRKSLRASSTGWRAIVWSASSTPARRCSALLCCLRLASRSTAFAAGQSKPKRYGRASRYQGACQAAYAMRYVLEQNCTAHDSFVACITGAATPRAESRRGSLGSAAEDR